jgi:hypothetical protein
VIYDPRIVVDHAPAPRPVGDTRNGVVADRAHNLFVSLCCLDRSRIPRQLLYSLLLGDRVSPGLARLLVAAARGEREVISRFVPAQRGVLAGLATLRRSSPADTYVTCTELRAAEEERG